MKYCSNSECEEINPRPLTEFYKQTANKDGLQNYCKKCHKKQRQLWDSKNQTRSNENSRNWARNNPERTKAGFLKNEYWPELTRDEVIIEYNKLIEQQNGLCAICGLPETVKLKGKTKELSVDHNHKTGKVRGLLCSRHNQALGLVNEDIQILENMINYLRKFN